ncbi:MAG TPA: hypothetical protein VMW56_25815 [Candidatus Margulisiibacteriota bacterium]|nr:hypothetical protein [Candidatus Margulisiibacteriota bacterium]
MKEAVCVAIGLAIVVLLAMIVYQNHRRFHRPLLTTAYQAVVLQSGAVYYGRIAHLGTDHPVLRDVFTVRQERDAETGQPRYVMVQRKDEVNGADHMILTVSAIAFVEPVQPDSPVGRLVEQTGPR